MTHNSPTSSEASRSPDEIPLTPDEESLSPDEAFAVLGDPTRIAILRALFENPHEPTTFSNLRETVGVRDSGQFNYHLDKLVGRFVRKTGDGYLLRLAGWQVAGAILAGTYTDSGNSDSVSFDHDCPEFGGVVAAAYADERVTVACEECGEQFSAAGVPPGALADFDREELPERFDRFVRGLVDQARHGVCVSCTGRMDPEVVTDPASDPDLSAAMDTEDDSAADGVAQPLVAYRCRRCPEIVTASLGAALLDHPAVVAFHWEQGIDLREIATWTLPWLGDDYVTVESDDPLRVRVAVELEDGGDGSDEEAAEADDRLELVVDERANVVETTTGAA